MAIDYYDSTNGDGLFQVLGKGFNAIDAMNTATGTTVHAALMDVVRQFAKVSNPTADLASAMDGLVLLPEQGGRGLDGVRSQLRQKLSAYLVEVVNASMPQPTKNLSSILTYLVADMIREGYYVNANVPGATLWATAGNVGDAAILYTTKRGDGRDCELTLSEDVIATVTNASGPSISLKGQAAQGNKLGERWPDGSGANKGLTATRASASLLTNGDFEDETILNVPDGWTIDTGTPGTHVYLTQPEVQTVAISGTPTAGYYSLRWSDRLGIVRTTGPLGYAATASEVQTALNALPGLANVTVTSSGTSPDLTHTVTFTGMAGNVSQLTSVNNLTGGTPVITHATTTAGSDYSYAGKALVFVSDGATLNTVHCPLSLSPDTVYFFHCRMKRFGVAAAGVIKAEIIDGIGGSVTADSESNSNVLTVNVAPMTGDWESQWFAFRVAPGFTNPLYLRLRISTAITTGVVVGIDQAFVAAGQELYKGGPWVLAAAGRTASIVGDSWLLRTTNDRAGLFQTWFERAFDMAAKGLLLPVAGTTLIPAAVITDEESSASSASSLSSSSSSNSSSSSSSPSSNSSSSSSCSSSVNSSSSSSSSSSNSSSSSCSQNSSSSSPSNSSSSSSSS